MLLSGTITTNIGVVDLGQIKNKKDNILKKGFLVE